jgi:outer membrane protein assembly factor BamB
VRALSVIVVALGCGAAPDDWPMWGGRPDRNMVSGERGLPAEWDAARHVRWTAELGSQTFSSPAVGGGRIFIGTSGKRGQSDRGVLLCLSARDGTLLWQAVHEKLPTGDAEDYRSVGIASTPCVADDRVFYVSNRGELACRTARDGEVVWTLDMRRELGVSPHQASASSPLVVDDLVFVVTGHGVDFHTRKVRNPAAPSFIAVDRKSGKVAWKDSSPGERLVEGQWGSPAFGVVEGVAQVAFPGGDGWLYAFEPGTGRLLWKFDCNAHESKRSGNHLLATPVFAGHRVIIASGANPDAGEGEGGLRAIDARRRGDATSAAELWRLSGAGFGRSLSTVAVHDGLVYAAELGGFLNCIDLETSARVWRHDLNSMVWGSPLVADGKVFIRTWDGEAVVFAHGREKRVLATNKLPGLRHGSVVAAGGALYVAGESRLYALASR